MASAFCGKKRVPPGLDELFDLLDTDGSDTLTKEKVVSGRRFLKLSAKKAAALFDALDVDGDGVLVRDELRSYYADHQRHMAERDSAEAEMRAFLAARDLGRFADAFVDFGVERLAELGDTMIVNAATLRSEIGMDDAEVEVFFSQDLATAVEKSAAAMAKSPKQDGDVEAPLGLNFELVGSADTRGVTRGETL